MTATAQPTYDERLTAPRSWWFIALLAGVALGLIVLPYGPLPMMGGLVVGTAIACTWVSGQGSSRIRVINGLLIADDAKIPVQALGAPEILEERNRVPGGRTRPTCGPTC